MTEGYAILVLIAVVGAIFWACAMLRHRNCDMGKLFTLTITVVGAVTGAFLFVRAFDFLRSSKEDAVWTGVAGVILALYSVHQVVTLFREIFAAKVEPIKSNDGKP